MAHDDTPTLAAAPTDEASPAKVLWVTGGGSGMGRAAALEAARAGWRVAVSGRRAEKLEQVTREIAQAGGDALALPLDVTDPAAVTAAAAQVVEQWGRIDGLVLAAGLNAPRRRWDDQDLAELTAIPDPNPTAVARALHAPLPAPRGRAGVAYSASKTAVGSLIRTLNQQEAQRGVRACHLCPGDVATDFLDQRPEVPGAEARARMLSPEDVGAAIGFVLTAPAHWRVDEFVLSPVSQA